MIAAGGSGEEARAMAVAPPMPFSDGPVIRTWVISVTYQDYPGRYNTDSIANIVLEYSDNFFPSC